MKITKEQLKEIIKEEILEVLDNNQLEEAEDSASIKKSLRDLESKANKTEADYVRIADLEKKLNAKLGKRTRSQGVSYNPYDY